MLPLFISKEWKVNFSLLEVKLLSRSNKRSNKSTSFPQQTLRTENINKASVLSCLSLFPNPLRIPFQWMDMCRKTVLLTPTFNRESSFHPLRGPLHVSNFWKLNKPC